MLFLLFQWKSWKKVKKKRILHFITFRFHWCAHNFHFPFVNICSAASENVTRITAIYRQFLYVYLSSFCFKIESLERLRLLHLLITNSFHRFVIFILFFYSLEWPKWWLKIIIFVSAQYSPWNSYLISLHRKRSYNLFFFSFFFK